MTSDKARYVPHGVNAGAPDGHCARLPQYAAGVLRCTACVRGRAGQKHWHAYAAYGLSVGFGPDCERGVKCFFKFLDVIFW